MEGADPLDPATRVVAANTVIQLPNIACHSNPFLRLYTKSDCQQLAACYRSVFPKRNPYCECVRDNHIDGSPAARFLKIRSRLLFPEIAERRWSYGNVSAFPDSGVLGRPHDPVADVDELTLNIELSTFVQLQGYGTLACFQPALLLRLVICSANTLSVNRRLVVVL